MIAPEPAERPWQYVDARDLADFMLVTATGRQAGAFNVVCPREAGVTTGFVTHYFDDKQQLLAAVVRHNNMRARDRLLAAVGERRGLVALEGAVDALLPIDDDRRRLYQIPGTVPLPGTVKAGCPFYARCPDRIDKCAKAMPPMFTLAPGQSAACWVTAGATS